MQPTAAPWAKKPASGEAPPPTGMPPTAGLPPPAGTRAAGLGSLPLPAISRGELTTAPWAAGRGGMAGGPAPAGRPVDAAVPHAAPRLPPLAADDFSAHRFAPPTKRIQAAEQLPQFLRSETARDFVSFILALNEAAKGRSLSDACHVRSGCKGSKVGGGGTRALAQQPLPASRCRAVPPLTYAGVGRGEPAGGRARHTVALGGRDPSRRPHAALRQPRLSHMVCAHGRHGRGGERAAALGRRSAGRPAGRVQQAEVAMCGWRSPCLPRSACPMQLVAGVLPPELQAAAPELGGYWTDSFGNATRIDYGTGVRWHRGAAFCLLYACCV